MGNRFKFSLVAVVIPIVISVLGYLIVPHQIIVQFNQPTYDNKIWIFFVPIVLIVILGLFAFLVMHDRKKQGFSSSVVATALENRLTIADFLLILVGTIIIISQIVSSK